VVARRRPSTRTDCIVCSCQDSWAAYIGTMNAKRKGTRNEHRSRSLLEAAGYAVTRAAGSLGAWDLIGVSATDFVLVQCKSNRGPSPVEREALGLFRCPSNCKRAVHIWRDRRRFPDVIML
jgi:Archaeal holliday junction resolvase (hjc)